MSAILLVTKQDHCIFKAEIRLTSEARSPRFAAHHPHSGSKQCEEVPHSELSPNTLEALALLAHPDHPRVKLLLDGASLLIDPKAAMQRLYRGDYTICWKSKRVKWIRLISKPSKWQACWRNTKAVALEPSLEWGRTTEWGN